MVRHIPNFITSLAVLSGSMAVVLSFEVPDNQMIAAYFILLASVFDFLDGAVARLLKAQSEMGKQLDSLSDMLSFGFAPSVVLFHLLRNQTSPQTALENLPYGELLLLAVPFLLVVFSALRLANFNIDTRQSESFIGLPTPANAIFVASLPFAVAYSAYGLFINTWFIAIYTFAFSFLLVAEFPMFSLKFKNLRWADNRLRYGFLASTLLIVIVFQFLAIPLIISLYVVLSAINNLTVSAK